MLPGERLVALVLFLLISFLINAVIFYIIGYKSGRRDEGEEWAEKKDYYDWLLEMKKRQDFEGVVEIKEKDLKNLEKKANGRKKEKKIVKGYSATCEYCGTPIKKGSLCEECRKAGW